MIKKFILFIFGGFSNTIFSYIFYCIFNLLFHYQTSYLLSLIVSVIYIFNFNNKFVFKVKTNFKNYFGLFFLYLIQASLAIVLLDLWIEKYSINEFVAPMLNILILAPTFFLINNFFSNKIKSKLN